MLCMVVLWRYLFLSFFRVFTLCISIFICVLLVIRFQDIAQFATLGTAGSELVIFVMMQIPEILPIALPISSLISAFLCMQRLSEIHVITAIRAAGLSFKQALYPFQAVGVFLTLLTLLFTCELTPLSRTMGKELLYSVTMNNPLLLLQKNRLIKLKDSYLEMDMVRSGEQAQGVLLAFKNPRSGRINLLTAKELKLERGGTLAGDEVSLIAHMPSKEAGFDHLMIDNQKKMEAPREALLALTTVKQGRLSLSEASTPNVLKTVFSGTSKYRRKASIELCKRLSFALTALSFVMIGAIFGLHISRGRSRKGLFLVISLCMMTFAFFLTARSLSKRSYMPVLLYILPHPILYAAGKIYVRRLSRGIE